MNVQTLDHGQWFQVFPFRFKFKLIRGQQRLDCSCMDQPVSDL